MLVVDDSKALDFLFIVFPLNVHVHLVSHGDWQAIQYPCPMCVRGVTK
jgi:hypothetical protein